MCIRDSINAEHEYAEPDTALNDDEEIEDLAPLSMRFNAGLFDLIVAVSVLSLIHISEPTRPYSNSYAVFCLKQKNIPCHAHMLVIVTI